jgi:hypothetical protein
MKEDAKKKTELNSSRLPSRFRAFALAISAN